MWINKNLIKPSLKTFNSFGNNITHKNINLDFEYYLTLKYLNMNMNINFFKFLFSGFLKDLKKINNINKKDFNVNTFEFNFDLFDDIENNKEFFVAHNFNYILKKINIFGKIKMNGNKFLFLYNYFWIKNCKDTLKLKNLNSMGNSYIGFINCKKLKVFTYIIKNNKMVYNIKPGFILKKLNLINKKLKKKWKITKMVVGMFIDIFKKGKNKKIILIKKFNIDIYKYINFLKKKINFLNVIFIINTNIKLNNNSIKKIKSIKKKFKKKFKKN